MTFFCLCAHFAPLRLRGEKIKLLRPQRLNWIPTRRLRGFRTDDD
jgi:hypothetical protein